MSKKQPSTTSIRKTALSKEVSQTLPARKKQDPTMPKSNWSEVEQIYQTCAVGIIDILKFTESTQEIFKKFPEKVKPEIITCVKGLARDLDELSKNLVKIHKNHETRTGVIESDLDHKISMDILQDYIGFNERFKSTVITPVTILSTEIVEIEEQLEKAEHDTTQ